MADGAISWWEIDVPDIGKATAFYSAITNWQLAPMEGYEGYVIVNAGGVGIGALQASQDPDPSGRGTRLYVEVGDQWVATARDPFGNRIGFATNNPAT